MQSTKNPLSRKDNLVVQEVNGEVLVYDLNDNKAFCLNQTSALIWQACSGERTIPDISRFVSQKLNTPANEDLIWFALDQLKKEKLISHETEASNHFAGMSRRDVVKKVGLGTMIALPIVASMIAPKAINAQSGNCVTCVKFHSGAICSEFCSNKLGTCYENSGCGGGQATPNVTCFACQAVVGVCKGGGTTCSWKQP